MGCGVGRTVGRGVGLLGGTVGGVVGAGVGRLLQPGSWKETILVLHGAYPLLAKYSVVNQKVQSVGGW